LPPPVIGFVATQEPRFSRKHGGFAQWRIFHERRTDDKGSIDSRADEALAVTRIGRAPMNIDRAAIVRDRLSGMTLTAVSLKWSISRSLVCKLVNRARAGDRGSMPPLPHIVDAVGVAESSSGEARG
jgi:hypothetical protein